MTVSVLEEDTNTEKFQKNAIVTIKNTQRDQKQISILHLIFHRLTPVQCCLYLEKGAYPENLRVVFYHSRSFYPLMCQKKMVL